MESGCVRLSAVHCSSDFCLERFNRRVTIERLLRQGHGPGFGLEELPRSDERSHGNGLVPARIAPAAGSEDDASPRILQPALKPANFAALARARQHS
jgi:hypothetical protein